jgi:hypothetical protein
MTQLEPVGSSLGTLEGRETVVVFTVDIVEQEGTVMLLSYEKWGPITCKKRVAQMHTLWKCKAGSEVLTTRG